MESRGGRRWKRGLAPDLGLGLTETTRKALSHQMRRMMLRGLHESGEPESPVEMMKRLRGASLTLISYHAGILRDNGVIRLQKEGQVRGATQHFYVSAVAGDPEVEEVLAATEADDREPGTI
jgi:DNA-binding transcriptional ArsR family regulator